MPAMPRDTKTRYQGVFARHRKACKFEQGGERCSCKPSYYGTGWDRARGRTIKTKFLPSVDAAKNARADLIDQLSRGEIAASGGLRLSEARERFIAAAREGRALNKWGKRYKPKAIDDLEGTLKLHVEKGIGDKKGLGHRRVTDIRRGDIQQLVDDRQVELSGSRIRGIVNAIRALYTYLEDRELVTHDPAARIRLPAMDATPVDRVASSSEFAALLAALDAGDALAYALAGYGFARAEQIRRLRWREVNLDLGLIEWGVEWEAAKYEASHRVVPCVPPLLALLKRVYLEQGRPAGDALVCPPSYRSPSGLMSTGGLSKRARKRWAAAGLAPITLQESRHTAATWIDAAGISPRVGSYLMGHATPSRQPGAATITLQRYTHTLPEDVERARTQLAAYLSASEARARGTANR